MNLAQLEARALKRGIEMDIDRAGSEIRATAWAPAGFVFASSGERCVALHWHAGPVAEFCDAMWELIDEMDDGEEPDEEEEE